MIIAKVGFSLATPSALMISWSRMIICQYRQIQVRGGVTMQVPRVDSKKMIKKYTNCQASSPKVSDERAGSHMIIDKFKIIPPTAFMISWLVHDYRQILNYT